MYKHISKAIGKFFGKTHARRLLYWEMRRRWAWFNAREQELYFASVAMQDDILVF